MDGRATEHPVTLAKGRAHGIERVEPTTVSDISGLPGRLRWPVRGGGRYVQAVKAIQIEEFGGPEVMKHVELPDPEPAEGQMVVDVARAGINFADTHATRNDYLAEQTRR